MKKTEEESPEPKIELIGILRGIVKRIKSQVLLFGIATIIIFILASANPNLWIGLPFVIIHLSTLTCYSLLKIRGNKKEVLKSNKKEGFTITMNSPEAIPAPYVCYKEDVRIVPVTISFDITNKSAARGYKVRIDVLSESESVNFATDLSLQPRNLPFSKRKRDTSKRQTIETIIEPKKTENITFHKVLIPKNCHKDYNLKNSVLIKHRFYAISLDENTSYDSGVKRLEIPFKENVLYAKERIMPT
jgi:hypothetical protein